MGTKYDAYLALLISFVVEFRQKLWSRIVIIKLLIDVVSFALINGNIDSWRNDYGSAIYQEAMRRTDIVLRKLYKKLNTVSNSVYFSAMVSLFLISKINSIE